MHPLSPLCELQAVSYTHLDVYKRQYSQISTMDPFPPHRVIKSFSISSEVLLTTFCLLYTSRCV